jgi:hypothetical protein
MLRSRRVALVVAPLATVAAVGAGVAATSADRAVNTDVYSSNLSSSSAQLPTGREVPDRSLGTSRSMDRVPLKNHSKPAPRDTMWTTTDLNLRVDPRQKTKVAGVMDPAKKVEMTGRHQGPFAEVVIGKTTRWVTAEYLSKDKPAPPKKAASSSGSTAGVSDAPCPDGSEIESGLQPQTIKIYRAVCAAFPELTTYGGQDGHGEHVNGEAIDFMVPNSSVGEQVKDYVYAHRVEFDLYDIIWSQHIWSAERSSEGFRPMEDRGSPTANHYDHVHIKIN